MLLAPLAIARERVRIRWIGSGQWPATGHFLQNIYDLGDGDVDFPACHRVLKSALFKNWLIVDLDIARQGPRVSYERCGAYVVKTLEPIYV